MSRPIDEQIAQADRERDVTEGVVGSFIGAPDARLREVMVSLVRHLHAFARKYGSRRTNG